MPGLLTNNGILFLCTFNMKHHEIQGLNEEYCLTKDELVNFASDQLELLKHETVAYDNKNMDTYVFRKIGSDEGYK